MFYFRVRCFLWEQMIDISTSPSTCTWAALEKHSRITLQRPPETHQSWNKTTYRIPYKNVVWKASRGRRRSGSNGWVCASLISSIFYSSSSQFASKRRSIPSREAWEANTSSAIAGLRHARHFATLTPRAELIAVSSPVQAELDAAKKEFAAVRIYLDYDEMLQKESTLQAVVVASATTVHAEQAIKAIEKGLHVLCEKPLSTSPSIVRLSSNLNCYQSFSSSN